MMFLNPVILASEFLQHAVTLVLIGLLIVEFFVHSADRNIPSLEAAEVARKGRQKKRETVALFVSTLLIAGRMIQGYFFDLHSSWFDLMTTTMIFLIAAGSVGSLAIRHWKVISKPLFFLFIAGIGLYILFVSHALLQYTPWEEAERAFAKSLMVVSLYFFVLRFLVDTDEHIPKPTI